MNVCRQLSVIAHRKIHIRNFREHQRKLRKVIIPAQTLSEPVTNTVGLDLEFFRDLGEHLYPVIELCKVQPVHTIKSEIALHGVQIRNGVCYGRTGCEYRAPSVIMALNIAYLRHHIIAPL